MHRIVPVLNVCTLRKPSAPHFHCFDIRLFKQITIGHGACEGAGQLNESFGNRPNSSSEMLE